MRIVCVARDAASSRAFARLAPVLRERGATVVTFLGNGKPLTDSIAVIVEWVRTSDCVILGMSSSAELAVPEIAAAHAARDSKIPYGFNLDIPHCEKREWFGELRDCASFFFAPSEKEREVVARQYPRAKVFATGNPLREEDFFLPLTHEEVRERLGVTDNENMILAVGIKSPVVNLGMWSLLMDALDGDMRFCVFLAYHPGDRTVTAVDPDLARKIARERGISLDEALKLPEVSLDIYGDLMKSPPKNVRVALLPSSFETAHAVPGADIVVEFGSSVGMTAAAQRVPLITLSTAIGRQRFISVSGTDVTEAMECGVTKVVKADADCLKEEIDELLADFHDLREKQEANLPKPTERGAAIRKMADAVFTFIPRS